MKRFRTQPDRPRSFRLPMTEAEYETLNTVALREGVSKVSLIRELIEEKARDVAIKPTRCID